MDEIRWGPDGPEACPECGFAMLRKEYTCRRVERTLVVRGVRGKKYEKDSPWVEVIETDEGYWYGCPACVWSVTL